MDHALNYSIIPQSNMQGGDGLYNKMTSIHLFREAQDAELEHKTKKVVDKISENFNIVANEPSLAFFRIQEHVRKSLPQLVEQKHEVQDMEQRIQGASFDTEYATNAVKNLQGSQSHFQNIQDLLKNSIFLKQQLDYKQDKSMEDSASSRSSESSKVARPKSAVMPSNYGSIN